MSPHIGVRLLFVRAPDCGFGSSINKASTTYRTKYNTSSRKLNTRTRKQLVSRVDTPLSVQNFSRSDLANAARACPPIPCICVFIFGFGPFAFVFPCNSVSPVFRAACGLMTRCCAHLSSTATAFGTAFLQCAPAGVSDEVGVRCFPCVTPAGCSRRRRPTLHMGYF